MIQPEQQDIFYGNTLLNTEVQPVSGEYVTLLDDDFYCIRNYDKMPPFFITLVSGSNHWLFISTTGGLSAGRISAEHALFPYYTVDKITENSGITGAKALLLVSSEKGRHLWEPFSNRYTGLYRIERNLYKNIAGTALVFEEQNHDLKLTYRYAWRSSNAYGFVKTGMLFNRGEDACTLELLDGLQNILPAHVSPDVQNTYSNLLDAYKYSELHAETGLAMFALSSRLTDLAEPSESLRSNTVWQVGLENVSHLLSSKQLRAFRNGQSITEETYVRGQRGAYFVHTQLELAPAAEQQWHLVAEVEQDSANVPALLDVLSESRGALFEHVETDIKQSQQELDYIVARADGLQVSSDNLSTAHHFANVLFNVMRGGIFADNHQVDAADLQDFIAVHHPALLQSQAGFFAVLPEMLTVSALQTRVNATDDTDLMRLCYSYLPLMFSRRHGDPSRPWNRFQINLTQPDGSQRLDYQGNWRDIFQNWEALSYAYPEFVHGMVAQFLNAITVDGYNPYRITRDGIDWEVPEPDNPWANIGYWNDHQIIYLQKLLEVCERFYPQDLAALLNRRMFSYANVPYRIKHYSELLEDPYDSIAFDWDAEEVIQKRVSEMGADGKLVMDSENRVIHATLTEKLLVLLLAKLVNFVPEGGIWLNTQRPEWNDANNALVGKGLSVVTLAYLRRYVVFFRQLLQTSAENTFDISRDVARLLADIRTILETHRAILTGEIDDTQRRVVMDALGQAGSNYRWQCYEQGISGEIETVSRADLTAFLELAQTCMEHSLQVNKRDDDLYHAYNTLHFTEDSARISHLAVMLEGQVAILSSGLLTPQEALALLKSMRQSTLYREDQHSYMLYPDRKLPGFLEKNQIPADALADSKLVATLHEHNDTRLIKQDVNGVYHFNGDVRNEKDVARILETLAQDERYAAAVKAEHQHILDVFEDVFNHAAFTGRSGTFFAFEGLGSIYWHMVSKLLLAVQENLLWATKANASEEITTQLLATYDDIRAGIGFNKSPEAYGAFPTDPYSHSPMGQGAKQPGMTGMVKEEILTRLLEVGLEIEGGMISFNPMVFREQELLDNPSVLSYVDLNGHTQKLDVAAEALAFTFCQVPFVVQRGNQTGFMVQYADGTSQTIDGMQLDAENSARIFARDGSIQYVTFTIA